ncbi:MAG TPA: GAF domain-containing protein, partial [Thermomicrobiales bacterium]|nr:GAF domain-containing protein [Thermomicrobiales bacterium]
MLPIDGTGSAPPSPPMALFAIDERQRIVQWSDAAAALVETPAAQALERPCYAVVQGHDSGGRPICQPGCPAFRAIGAGHLAAGSTLVVVGDAAAPRRIHCNLRALPQRPGGALGCLTEGAGGAGAPASAAPQSGRGAQSRDILRDLAAFATLATALAADDVLARPEQLLDRLREATDAEAAELFLAEPSGHGLVLTAYRGPFCNAFCQRIRFASGEGFPGLALADGRALSTDALAADGRYLRARVKEKGFRAYACVPLVAAGLVVGAIGVGTRRTDVHMGDALRFLTWVSGPIATALRAGLFQAQSMAAPDDLHLRGDDGDLDRRLRDVLRRVQQVAQADAGVLLLLSQSTGRVVHRVADGARREPACADLDAADPSLTCPALSEGHGMVLCGARASWPAPCRGLRHPGSTTYCLPLRAGGADVGVIQLAYASAAPIPPARHLTAAAAAATPAAAIVAIAREHAERA